MGRVLIFAGAGASKGVSPQNFPTTVEFFEQIPSDIKRNKYFELVSEYLMADKGTSVIDIEMILWALQQLRDDFLSISGKGSVTGFAFSSEFVNRVIDSRNVGHINQISAAVVSEVDQLMGNINGLVYNLYSYEPAQSELEQNWINLISKFEGVGDSLEIVTTNYDIAIEAALDIIQGPETSKEWRGITGRIRHKLDLARWVGERSHVGRLTKLHGSLDWKRAGEDIFVGDSVFTGDHKKQMIIYPGFKGSVFDQQFSTLHSYFSDVLYESDIIIFVGFAFRDEYINNIIRSAINPSSRVYVVNPDASVRMPTTRGRIKYIAGYFDESSIAKISLPRG